MNSNYKPPQIQHQEFFAWAREYLLLSIDEKSGQDAADSNSSKQDDMEVDVDDFIAHVISSKGGKRFGRQNVKRWRKDATKALRHAIRLVSQDNIYIDRIGDKDILAGEELIHYPDENQMNRSLFHKNATLTSAPNANSAHPTPNAIQVKHEKNGSLNLEMENEEPPKKRLKVKAKSVKEKREQPSSSAASEIPCEVPNLTLGSVPFVSPSAVDELLMLTIGVQMQHRGAFTDNSENADASASEHAKAASCLLLGPPGSGKSTLLRAVAGTLGMALAEVSALSLTSTPTTASALLSGVFEKAVEAAPSVLLISDVDSLPVNATGKSGSSSAGVRDVMVTCMRKAANRVLVVGESSLSLARMNDSVKRLFPESVTLGAMDLTCRRKALHHLVKTFSWESRFPASLLSDLAVRTPGFEIEDLHRLLWRLQLSAPLPAYLKLLLDQERNPRHGSVSTEDLLKCQQSASLLKPDVVDEALAKVVPLAKQKPGFVSVPSVTWADVGALHGPKQELERFLTMVREPELASALCREAESLLLVGPPGCGKTMLAKALSNEAGLNFISVKGPEILNKFLGESERQIRELFERARACPPCLIFFDELDALCGRRDAESNSGHTSVVLQLLTEMDGLSPRGRVFVMGATNRLDIIDEAFLRRGRMGRVVHVGPPGSAEERAQVLSALTRLGTKPHVAGVVKEIFSSVAEDPRLEGFTGAELRGIIDEAKFAAQMAKRDHLCLSDLQFGVEEILKTRLNMRGPAESRKSIVSSDN